MMHTFKRITLIIIVNICKFLPVGVSGCVMSYIIMARASVGCAAPCRWEHHPPGPAPLHHGPRTLATPTLIVCHQERESSHGQHSKLDTDYGRHISGGQLCSTRWQHFVYSLQLFLCTSFALIPMLMSWCISTRCSQN